MGSPKISRVPCQILCGPLIKCYDLSRRLKDVISEPYFRLTWLEQVLDSPELVEATVMMRS
jgi:hypothetical protein